MKKSALKFLVKEIIEELGDSEYKIHPFKWMANMAGFNYPLDVHYGTILLGVLEAMEDGFVILMVSTPRGNIGVKKSQNNKFKSAMDAAKVLHHVWKLERTGVKN